MHKCANVRGTSREAVVTERRLKPSLRPQKHYMGALCSRCRMSKRLVFPTRTFVLSGGALAAYGLVGGTVAEVAALPAANAARQALEPRSVAFSAPRGAWLLFFRALGGAASGVRACLSICFRDFIPWQFPAVRMHR